MIHPVSATNFYSKSHSINKSRQITFNGKAELVRKLESVQQLVKNSNFDEVQCKKLFADLEVFESNIKKMVDKFYNLQKKCEALESENRKLKEQLGQSNNSKGSGKSFIESYVEFKESYDLGPIYSP